MTDEMLPGLKHVLRKFDNYVHHAPSCLTHLMRLRVLRALVPLRLTCFIYAPCAPSSRTLHALSTPVSIIFARLKIFPELICSPSKSFHFPRAMKGTTIPTVLFSCGSKKETF